jgi:Flp pilus assembly protein TadG
VTIEFALVLPIVLLVFFAGFEFSRVHTICNTVENASYEGARRGIVPGATEQDIIDSVNRTLSAGSINGATVTVSPNPFTSSAATVTVEVSVPIQQNLWMSPMFFQSSTWSSKITLNSDSQSSSGT